MLRPALAALLAVPVVVLGVPADAAPPTCQGRPATVVGTPGADRLTGTSGPDVVVARGGDDRVRGLGGDDLICGGEGADDLLGGPGADELHGGTGSVQGRSYRGDLLDGGSGDDLLDPHGGPVPDVVRGVTRADGVTYRSSPRAVRVDLAAGTAAGLGEDTIVTGRRVQVLGSRFDDVLLGSDLRDSLDGGRGDDELSGAGGRDFLVADDGDDHADGGPAHDWVVGNRGVDILAGGDGGDFILASSWRPTTVLGGPGADFVWRWITSGPIGTLDGGDEENQLVLTVQMWFDAPRVRADLDRAAQTAVMRAEGRTRTTAFSGFDAFILEDADWTYTGTDEDDFVQVLMGRLHAQGLGGDDYFLGDEGNDVLDGGEGTDTAWGGAGRNTCVDTEEGDCDGLPSARRTRPRTGDRPELLAQWFLSGSARA